MAKSVEEYWNEAETLIDEGRDRNATWADLDKLYWQDKPETDSEDVQIVVTPHGTNAVDLVTDLASVQELTLEVPAQKESAQAQRQADEQEQWLQALLSLNERVTGRNLTADMAWLATMRAMVVVRTLFTDALLRKQGDKWEVSSVPVLFQVRDPAHVYAREGVDGIECVVEKWDRKVSDIRRQYPGVLDDDKYKDESTVEWVEYWDDTYRIYWAGGRPCPVAGKEIVPHGYGVLPYSFGYGRVVPGQGPGKRYRPLLAGVASNLRSINTWFSILATAGWASVTNSWLVFSDHYGIDGGKELSTGPGDVNYLSNDDKVQPLQRAELPGDFFRMGDLLMQQFQAGTFPLAMYGQVSGDMAGYAINMLTQSGRRALMPIWKAIEAAYEGALRNAVLICKNKVAPLLGGSEVPLMIVGTAGEKGLAKRRKVKRTLSLDTEQVDASFDVMVSLGDPMPSDEAQNIRLALETVGGKLLSQQTALTKFKVVPDAVDELERIAVEDIYRQLAPVEAVKVAQARGYLPSRIELPEGFHMMPDGRIMPDDLMEVENEPEEEAPDASEMQQIAGMPPAMPTMEQMAGMPPTMMPGMV